MKLEQGILKLYESLMADKETRLTGRMLLKEAKRRRREWMAQARKSFNPKHRQPCLVCGMHEAMSEAHHVINLSHQYYMGYTTPVHDYVWLCPNHHSVLHKLESGKDSDTVLGILPLAEIKIINEIYKINKKAWNEYFETM